MRYCSGICQGQINGSTWELSEENGKRNYHPIFKYKIINL